MNRWLKFGAIGCASLFGLVVILIVLVAALSGTDTSPPETASQSDEEQSWNQSQGEIYRGEDPSLYMRSFNSQKEFEDFVDEEKATEEREAERERQQAERAQQDAVEEQAQAEREQQEAEAAQEEAGAPAPEEETQADSATIRITGEAGQAFSGSYGNIDTTQSVDGTVPTEYEQEVEMGFLSADSVTAVMQKNTPGSWELGVEIVVDGEVVKETSTTAEYGVATVTWSPLDE